MELAVIVVLCPPLDELVPPPPAPPPVPPPPAPVVPDATPVIELPPHPSGSAAAKTRLRTACVRIGSTSARRCLRPLSTHSNRGGSLRAVPIWGQRRSTGGERLGRRGRMYGDRVGPASSPLVAIVRPEAACEARYFAIMRTSSALVIGCHPCGFIGRPYSKVKLARGSVSLAAASSIR